MKALRQIDTLKETFDFERLAFAAAQRELDAIADAVAQRQTDERKQHEAKRADLEDKANNIRYPLSVRRLAAQELDCMEGYQPTITSNERQAFQEEAAAARLALSDLLQTSAAIRTALSEAKQELEHVKDETVRTMDVTALENSIRGSVERFHALGR